MACSVENPIFYGEFERRLYLVPKNDEFLIAVLVHIEIIDTPRNTVIVNNNI